MNEGKPPPAELFKNKLLVSQVIKLNAMAAANKLENTLGVMIDDSLTY